MRFNLSSLLGVVIVAAVVVAVVVPGLSRSARTDRELKADSGLCTLKRAQADWRSNDCDGNGVADFWTADVFRLHGLIPPGSDRAVQAVDESFARADAHSQKIDYPHALPQRAGRSRHGYWYCAFASQDDGGPTTLANDTDGPGAYGGVHDRSRFGLMVFPDGTWGKLMFIVNCDMTHWK